MTPTWYPIAIDASALSYLLARIPDDPGDSRREIGRRGTAEAEPAWRRCRAARARAATRLLIAPTLLDLTITSVNDSDAVVVRIVHDARAETDQAAADVDLIVGLDDVLLQSGRGRDDLERRSRLVEILDCAIAALARPASSRYAFGLNVGQLASARISPVARIHDHGARRSRRGSLRRRARSSRSAMCCRYWSIVSSSVAPVVDGRSIRLNA